ncbi:RNA 2'-phosphotransferase, partial [ANME-1 cluster archaeon GoMg2]|nr:RNA 2'-phosphotransferase [ANME-1 cluster archaeon GoMg2]
MYLRGAKGRRWFGRKEKSKPSSPINRKTLSELSKLMAYILRHDKKNKFLVDLDENCYAGISQLVKAISLRGKWKWVNRGHIEEVAAKSFYHGKKRFAIKRDKIKAMYRITRKCPSTPSPLPFNESEFYVITAKHSGKCLDVGGISTDDGANIIQWDYWRGDNEKWKLKPVGNDYYCIIAKHSGKCLDVSGISKNNGAKIMQYHYWGGDNQNWKLKPVGNGYYCIIAKHSGKCLDVKSKSKDDGAIIHQFRYMGGDNQKWKLKPVTTQEPPIRDPTSELAIAAENWFNRGLKATNLLKKIEYFTKALGFNPKHARAWRNKGYALENLGRYEEVIVCFDKALEIDSKNARAWSHKGYALNTLKRYEVAMTCLDNALKINPKYASAWYHKGFALFNLEKYEDAIRCVDKALAIKPMFEDAVNLKSRAEEKLKPVTIERAIFDPCKRDFVKRALPRMKEWINRYDPSAYWFAVSLQNSSDTIIIEEWDIELETSSALKIEEAKIEGIEIEIPYETHLGAFKISVPKEYGIVIPKGGAQRVYFKLRAEKPKTTYEISGVFKSAITGEVQIQPKEFKYGCDAGSLKGAILEHPEVALKYVEMQINRYSYSPAE